MKKKYGTIIFFIAVTLVFMLNFKVNLFSSAAGSFFDYFQRDGESLVVGRLILSEKNDLTEHSGFLGWVRSEPDTRNKFSYQYDAYQYGLDYDNYEGYYSQPGMQAFLFGAVCKITGWRGKAALDNFRWIVSFCSALAFTAFLFWVLSLWGWTTTIFTFVCLLFSQWITVYGRNLFWVVSAFYIPFLVALFWLHYGESKSKRPLLSAFCLMFASMFIKFLFTGFEYITTAMVMAVTPWVFYAVDKRWEKKKFIKSATAACGGVITAVVAGVAWLAVQISTLSGSLADGMHYIMWSFGKRAHGIPGETYDAIFQNSIEGSQWSVLSSYLNDHAFHVAHWFDSSLLRLLSIIHFRSCILFFVFISCLVFFSKAIKKNNDFYRRQIALTITLWVSFLAPLSWFVIFKGHSYIHTHMNTIVWYMPFMLFGFVLTGSVCRYLLKTGYINRKSRVASKEAETVKRKRNLWFTIPVFLIVIIFIRLFFMEIVFVSGSSMEKSFKSGDCVIVNKLRYGALMPHRFADIPLVNVLTWSDRFRLADENRNWQYGRVKGYADIRRNDVIVFYSAGHSTPLIKRVVGLPGETIELRSGELWVDGVKAEMPSQVIPGIREDTIRDSEGWTWSNYGPLHLPKTNGKGYFVLGDNRDDSIDSRHFGYISEDGIIGKVSLVIGSSGCSIL